MRVRVHAYSLGVSGGCSLKVTRVGLRCFFFFNDTATTEIYTLSLHDALPISSSSACTMSRRSNGSAWCSGRSRSKRSEEHTSELQSQSNIVCRLLLEKKKNDKSSPSAP